MGLSVPPMMSKPSGLPLRAISTVCVHMQMKQTCVTTSHNISPHEGVTAGISHNNIPYQLITIEKNLPGMLAMFTNRFCTGVLTSVVLMLLTS